MYGLVNEVYGIRNNVLILRIHVQPLIIFKTVINFVNLNELYLIFFDLFFRSG